MDKIQSLIPLFMFVGAIINTGFGVGLWMMKKQFETDGKKSIRTQVEELVDDLSKLETKVSEFHKRMGGIQEKSGTLELSIRDACAKNEADVRELRAEITRILEGQTEWTHTFRRRTHTMLGGINNIIMYVNQIGRGQTPVPVNGLKLITFGNEESNTDN